MLPFSLGFNSALASLGDHPTWMLSSVPEGVGAGSTGTQLSTIEPETLGTHAASQLACQFSNLPPPPISSGETEHIITIFHEGGGKSGCYSPRVVLISGHGKVCAYN